MLRSHIAAFVTPAMIIIFAFLPSPSWAASAVGTVKEVTGIVTVRHGVERMGHALKAGDDITENDAITTSAGAHVKIEFADKTELLVAEKGSVTVDKYVYDPAKPAENQARFTILKTAFYYIGGLMEKTSKPDVRINLDLGAIGIRGTRIMRAMKNGECWIYLQAGKISVFNKGGAVTLAPGEGTIIRAKAQAPEKPHV